MAKIIFHRHFLWMWKMQKYQTLFYHRMNKLFISYLLYSIAPKRPCYVPLRYIITTERVNTHYAILLCNSRYWCLRHYIHLRSFWNTKRPSHYGLIEFGEILMWKISDSGRKFLVLLRVVAIFYFIFSVMWCLRSQTYFVILEKTW